MSCGVALAVSLLLSDPNVAIAAAQPPVAPSAPVSVASEPLFADIVARSGGLHGEVQAWLAAGAGDQADFFASPAFSRFKTQASELAALDMQGHLILKERGTDNDLKCILRGISEDIPVKVAAVEAAPNPAERRVALDELAYLLNDNVEVITAPPQPEA
ncbi:MAG: hypothetical protein QME55_02125 [Brevundimonas sp.]|uniref:hypothetical protein n=1 Tax=Brevundimonas sp. TaxID=1871086 RepID=UPI002637E730|nr:hypothetical protein [Brevundimonas sp.]MDI6623502.1 hypothetical protein [Brevundimonas sp.]MDQ7813623.1 hypothetical protein [Brevundimonas sp.]